MSEDYERARLGAKPTLGYETTEYRKGRESLHRDSIEGGVALGEMIAGLIRLMMSRKFLTFSPLLAGPIIGVFVGQANGTISGALAGFGLIILIALIVFRARFRLFSTMLCVALSLAMVAVGVLSNDRTTDRWFSRQLNDFELIYDALTN